MLQANSEKNRAFSIFNKKKLVVLGNSNVGKTTLIRKFVYNEELMKTIKPTAGAENC